VPGDLTDRGSLIAAWDREAKAGYPTTVAEHGDLLAIVNARFDLGLPPPLGTGVPPGTDYDVVLVSKP